MNANASIMGLCETESSRRWAVVCNGRVEIVCITRDLSSGKGLLLWSEEKMSSENDPNSVGGGVIGVAIANIVT